MTQPIPERYANIMLEVKHRLKAIKTANETKTGLVHPITRELCFLQLRMICELIALGCLIAHGDLPETKTKKLMSADYPGKIFPDLERINPDFFPRPVRYDHTFPIPMIAPVASNDHLTRKELIDFHHKSGSALHRGSLESFEDLSHSLARDLPLLSEMTNKIFRLLNMHAFKIKGGKVYLCVMETQSGSIEVSQLNAQLPRGA